MTSSPSERLRLVGSVRLYDHGTSQGKTHDLFSFEQNLHVEHEGRGLSRTLTSDGVVSMRPRSVATGRPRCDEENGDEDEDRHFEEDSNLCVPELIINI